MPDKKKLLYVGLDAHLTEEMKTRLTDWEIVNSASGREALKIVKGNPPDLIIIDHTLTDIKSFFWTRLVKFDRRFEAIPLIMLISPTETNRPKDIGINLYLEKPITSEAILRSIDSVMVNTA